MNKIVQEIQSRHIQYIVEHPEWRRGQALFNAIHDLRPKWAEELNGGVMDPFYSDSNCGAAIGYVYMRAVEEAFGERSDD